MVTMALLFPLSGFAAQLLQVIQKGRIKAADSRIGTISESKWHAVILSVPCPHFISLFIYYFTSVWLCLSLFLFPGR
jgi:hypothetical protein